MRRGFVVAGALWVAACTSSSVNEGGGGAGALRSYEDPTRHDLYHFGARCARAK